MTIPTSCLRVIREPKFSRGAPISDYIDVLSRRVATDSSYLSANDVRAHFGLGDHADIAAVRVHWSNGSEESFETIKSDRIVTLRQGSGKK